MARITLTAEIEQPEPLRFVHGVIRKTGIGQSWVPLVSIMASEAVTVELCAGHLLTDTDVIWQVLAGADLLDPEWTAPDGDGGLSRVTADRTALGIGLGQRRVVAAGLCATTAGNGADTQIINDDTAEGFLLGVGESLTLCVRRVDGTGGIVSAVLTWAEEVGDDGPV